MADNVQSQKKNLTPDWFVQGALTKLGDMFDRLLGRGWKPSSSLATSELIERLKALLDAEAREDRGHRRYIPHNIKLKMQWDKFATDSDDSLKKLESELLTATIDHINDRRYYTYAPVSLEVKPDYFISGVKLFVSFDRSDEPEREAQIELPVAGVTPAAPAPAQSAEARTVVARFSVNGKNEERKLAFNGGSRLSVGRTKENDLAIDEISVSKVHASFVLGKDDNLIVADTGSTNGTFINGERIAYGKARLVSTNDSLRFGSVDVKLERVPKPPQPELPEPEVPHTETFAIGEFEFTKRLNSDADEGATPTAVLPAVGDSQELVPAPVGSEEPEPTEAS